MYASGSAMGQNSQLLEITKKAQKKFRLRRSARGAVSLSPYLLKYSSFVQFIKKPRHYTFNVQRSHYRRLQNTEHVQLKKTVLFKKIPGTGKNLRIFW